MGQPRKMLRPDRSARDLWGAELRALRDRHGLSLAELASRIYYDASHLGKFERAERKPPRGIAEACDQVLGGTGVLVRLWDAMQAASRHEATPGNAANPPRHEANLGADEAGLISGLAIGTSAAAASGDEAVSLPVLLDGKVVYVSVTRRALLKLTGASAALAVPALGAPTPALGAPVAPAPDANPIEHLTAVRRVLIDNDNLFGPRAVIPAVQHQIGVMGHLRDQLAGVDRRNLTQLRAQFAEFASWLHQDAGDFTQAQFWLDRALEWAYAGTDHDLAAYVFARKAQLAGDMGDPMQAIDMGQAAEDMARPGTRLAAIAAVYTAHGHALRNDSDAADRAYERARVLVARGDFDPASTWGIWLDQAYISVHQARSLHALGQHEGAAAGFATAITNTPAGYHRDRGVYLARQAAAHRGARQPEQAAGIGMQALAVGAATQSARILTELATLDVDLMSRWPSVPEVAAFHQALTSAVPSAA